MRAQGYSETLIQKQTEQKNRAKAKQDRKRKPRNLVCSKHKGNYKTNLGKHINIKQGKENKIKTEMKDRKDKGSKNEYLTAKRSQA